MTAPQYGPTPGDVSTLAATLNGIDYDEPPLPPPAQPTDEPEQPPTEEAV